MAEPNPLQNALAEFFQFPVFKTLDGGLVRQQGGRYIFVVPPKGQPCFSVRGEMPQDWPIEPANELARR